MNVSNQGVCSHCGHINNRAWVLCDSCGLRLPWAPPEKPPLSMSELTDEELFRLHGPTPKRESSFLPALEDRRLWPVLVVLVLTLWWLLT